MSVQTRSSTSRSRQAAARACAGRKDERPGAVTDIDLGYFTPDSPHYRAYLDAVAAGGNFAILNRLLIFEQIADAFRKVFKEDLELRVILVPGSASGEVVAGPWPGPRLASEFSAGNASDLAVGVRVMQRGSAEIFLALGLILIGIFGLKLFDMNLFWAAIALGAAVGCHGGISISQRARV